MGIGAYMDYVGKFSSLPFILLYGWLWFTAGVWTTGKFSLEAEARGAGVAAGISVIFLD